MTLAVGRLRGWIGKILAASCFLGLGAQATAEPPRPAFMTGVCGHFAQGS